MHSHQNVPGSFPLSTPLRPCSPFLPLEPISLRHTTPTAASRHCRRRQKVHRLHGAVTFSGRNRPLQTKGTVCSVQRVSPPCSTTWKGSSSKSLVEDPLNPSLSNWQMLNSLFVLQQRSASPHRSCQAKQHCGHQTKTAFMGALFLDKLRDGLLFA